MADISNLYPQPPQAVGNALINNPGQVLGLAQQANALKAFQAQQAVGQAFQQNVNPDGSVNYSGAGSAIAGNPAAAYAAPEAFGSILAQRGQTIANATNQFNLLAGQSGAVANLIGPLAQNPKATSEDVLNLAPTLARMGVPAPIINGWMQNVLNNPNGIHAGLANTSNIAMGPAAAATRVTGAPNEYGAPTQQPIGTANFAQGPTPTDLPPGQSGALASNQTAFVNDQERSATTLGNVRQLQNALPLISQLSSSNFGPGSPELAQLKGILTTAGIMQSGDSSLPTREEANKYLLKYAQGAINAGRSDSALSTAIHSSPNLDLTQPANLALIKNQIGMDRMDAAIPTAFSAQHPGANDKSQYLTYKSNFYQNNDPRAFSFDIMTPQERRQTIDSLGPQNSPAFRKFAQSYQAAKASGVIQPENNNGQQ